MSLDRPEITLLKDRISVIKQTIYYGEKLLTHVKERGHGYFHVSVLRGSPYEGTDSLDELEEAIKKHKAELSEKEEELEKAKADAKKDPRATAEDMKKPGGSKGGVRSTRRRRSRSRRPHSRRR
jgi:hypothetical protein